MPTSQGAEGIQSLHGVRVICQIRLLLRLRLRLGHRLGRGQPGNLLRLFLQLRSRLPDQRGRPACTVLPRKIIPNGRMLQSSCAIGALAGADASHHTLSKLRLHHSLQSKRNWLLLGK